MGKSYRDALKTNDEETFDLTLVFKDNKARLKIPLALVEKTKKLWENCLVGRFSGPRPGLEAIRSWTKTKWKTGSCVEVIAMPKGCVLFKFASFEDMSSILLKAP